MTGPVSDGSQACSIDLFASCSDCGISMVCSQNWSLHKSHHKGGKTSGMGIYSWHAWLSSPRWRQVSSPSCWGWGKWIDPELCARCARCIFFLVWGVSWWREMPGQVAAFMQQSKMTCCVLQHPKTRWTTKNHWWSKTVGWFWQFRILRTGHILNLIQWWLPPSIQEKQYVLWETPKSYHSSAGGGYHRGLIQ